MPEHIYTKEDLISRFDAILNEPLGRIDNCGMFEHVQEFNLQKGVAGAVIEQCVLGYPPDTRQEADLIVVAGDERISTELKTTGMVISTEPRTHFVAKEPMSITAVGVYDLADQEFWTSHFWNKLDHMLIVYYHYSADHAVTPYEYRDFPIKGYEFHEFSDDDVETLKRDWEHVHELVSRIVSHHPGTHNREWKNAVKQEYIEIHGELRRVLSFIDLAPQFPPRFRLKKPTVNTMISRHFGYALEQLPGRYTDVEDIDRRCRELTHMYHGQTIAQLAERFGIELNPGEEGKAISERITVAMFGGTASKLNQIELFERFGLIGKTIVMTEHGTRTEDMKLYHVDFAEMTRTQIVEDTGEVREITFEDSDLYSYFADHELLCIIFEEPSPTFETIDGVRKKIIAPLSSNRFMGFKRLVFSDEFIETKVRALWEDTRDKVLNNRLIDVIQTKADGTPKLIGSGEISSAPNFMKSRENTVFFRGSGTDSSSRYKTEIVNGIHMLPQYVWIKGTAVVDELNHTPDLIHRELIYPTHTGEQLMVSEETAEYNPH